MSRAALLASVLAVAVTVPAAAQRLPTHPEALRFQPLAYSPPSPADHRVTLANGIVAFVAEDRTLPLVSLTVMTRTGAYLEPEGKEGLAALTGQQIRRGGTKSLTAEELDERLAFLATEVSSGIGSRTTQTAHGAFFRTYGIVLPIAKSPPNRLRYGSPTTSRSAPRSLASSTSAAPTSRAWSRTGSRVAFDASATASAMSRIRWASSELPAMSASSGSVQSISTTWTAITSASGA